MGRGQGEGPAYQRSETFQQISALAPHPNPFPDIHRGEGVKKTLCNLAGPAFASSPAFPTPQKLVERAPTDRRSRRSPLLPQSFQQRIDQLDIFHADRSGRLLELQAAEHEGMARLRVRALGLE